MERVLNQLFCQHTTDLDSMTLKTTAESGDKCNKGNISTMTDSKSDKGKSKVSEASSESTVSEASEESKVSEPSTAPDNKSEVAVPKTKDRDGCHIL